VIVFVKVDLWSCPSAEDSRKTASPLFAALSRFNISLDPAVNCLLARSRIIDNTTALKARGVYQ
jgi:hypothetical protein